MYWFLLSPYFAHSIGQKKPVSVYRMVTENTIEEKIVERAQQKLKLNAMVVQSKLETNSQGFAFILKLS